MLGCVWRRNKADARPFVVMGCSSLVLAWACVPSNILKNVFAVHADCALAASCKQLIQLLGECATAQCCCKLHWVKGCDLR